jgi:hypothetical protein
MNERYRIPVYQLWLCGNEESYVLDCLRSNWISSKGHYIVAFEELFAAYIGIRHALSVSNGTVALHVALAALGIRPGDEVIVPTLTYIAPVNAIIVSRRSSECTSSSVPQIFVLTHSIRRTSHQLSRRSLIVSNVGFFRPYHHHNRLFSDAPGTASNAICSHSACGSARQVLGMFTYTWSKQLNHFHLMLTIGTALNLSDELSANR